MKFFDLQGPVFTSLTKLADLFILNILFVIFSIPIVTMGAAWTALYTVTLKMSRDREGEIVKSFVRAFKDNFKKSTIIWLLILLFWFVGILNLRIIHVLEIPWEKFFYIISIMFMIMVFFVFLSVFPITARFENSIKNTIKNTFLIEVAYFPWILCIFGISVLPTIGVLFIPFRYGFIHLLWLFFGVSITSFLNSFIYEYRIFKNLMLPEEWE